MTNRSVVIALKGNIADFQAKMKQARVSIADTANQMTAAGKQGDEMRRSLGEIGDTAGKVGLLAAAGIGAAIAASANFESAMSGVKAATRGTAAEMDALREAALAAGASTVFSATEAADAVTNLAKAGVSTADILGGGLTGALDLAAAGEMDVAQAAEVAAGAMAQFGLKGSDMVHIADLLAAGAGKANGDVTDMAAALNQSGLIANQVGLSIEETTGALAAFAESSLMGSDAGTSFKTMLGALTPNSEKAAALMQEMGLSAFDAQGEFIGLSEFAGQLQGSLSTLTDQQRQATLETIFGSDAVRAAAVLYEQGADGIAEWEAKVNDAGYAAQTAAMMTDNLRGDLEELMGSLETALIGTGDSGQGMFRGIVQGATNTVNAFNELPPAAKSATAGVLGLTAAAGGGVWAFSKIVQGIANTRDALDDLNLSAGRAKGALGALGKGVELGAIILAVDILDEKFKDLFNLSLNDSSLARDLEYLAATGEATGTLFDVWGEGLGEFGDDLAKAQGGVIGFTDAWARHLPGNTFTEDLEDNAQRIDEALALMVEAGGEADAARVFETLRRSAVSAGADVERLSALFPEYEQALEIAASGTESSAGWFAESFRGIGGAANDAADDVDALGQALEELEAIIEERQSVRDYEQALDDFAEAVKRRKELTRELADAERDLANADTAAERETARDAIRRINDELRGYRLTLDEGAQAGRDWQERLEDIALGALTTATALTGLDQQRYLRKAREDFIDSAMKLDLTRKAARKLWDELAGLNNVDTSIDISVTTQRNAGKLLGDSYADGGWTGAGGKYQPKGVVHGNEYVFSSEATAGNVGYLEGLHRQLRGYASGGFVAASRPVPMAGGGWGGFDAAAVARELAKVTRSTPMVGEMNVQAHNINDIHRELNRIKVMESGGGAHF